MKPHFQYQRQHQHAPIEQCSIMSIEEHEGDSESTYEQLTISVDPSATVERHWPVKMRASFLLLLCVVLLATMAFTNEAKSDDASVNKQAEELTGEVHRVKRGVWWRWRSRRRRR
ncbi:hypothetical protein LSAT2_031759 [Lamellibrachia satsuma]|nr:hypothetical protein LSAT2_031759 [Lamellibrachia satsuma]